MKLPRRVIKVGGSLYTLHNLPLRLQAWLQQQAPARNLLIPGGGQLVDVVRRWDADFHLGDAAAHWLAVDLLDVAARMLHAVLPGSRLSTRFEDVSDSPTRIDIFAPGRFMREIELRLPGHPLPHDWSATSDSIAARVCEALDADELVLLKSTLAEPDLVDAHFAARMNTLRRIRAVNLRDDSFPERLLQSSADE